jgi:chromosome segregation ATPase
MEEAKIQSADLSELPLAKVVTDEREIRAVQSGGDAFANHNAFNADEEEPQPLSERSVDVTELEQGYENKISRLREELIKAGQHKTKLENQLDQLGINVRKFETGIEERDAKIEKMGEAITQLDNTIQDMDNEIDALMAKNDGLMQQIDALTSKVANTEKERNDKAQEITALSQQLADVSSNLERINDEKSRVVLELDAKNNEIARLNSEVSNLTSTKETLENQIRGLQDKLQNSEDTAGTLRAEVEELTAGKEALEIKVDALGKEIGAKQDQIDGLERQLSSEGEKSSAQVKSLQEQIESLTDEKAELTQEKAELEVLTDDLRKQVSSLDAGNASLKSQLEKANENVISGTSATKQLENKLAKTKAKRSDCVSQIAALETTLRQKEEEIEQMRKDHQRLNSSHQEVLAKALIHMKEVTSELPQDSIGELREIEISYKLPSPVTPMVKPVGRRVRPPQ